MTARAAYAECDALQHWKRAMLRKSQGTKEFATGDLCYRWRQEKTKGPQLAHWHGPATIVHREHDKYIIVHNDFVLRCSRSHLRRITSEEVIAMEVIFPEAQVTGEGKLPVQQNH